MAEERGLLAERERQVSRIEDICVVAGATRTSIAHAASKSADGSSAVIGMLSSTEKRACPMEEPATSPDVVLVMMPFGPPDMPSLGLSLLAGALRNDDISVRVLYPVVDFFKKIGSEDYAQISNAFGKFLAPEWIFSRFVDPVGTTDDFMARFTTTAQSGPQRADKLRKLLDRALPIAGRLIEDWAAAIAQMRPRIVGFSNSYEQHMACLALAMRIRELAPEIKIVFGGANCTTPMGQQTFLSYPVVDAVMVGPGEIAFPRLVREILDGVADIRIPGVYWRGLEKGAAPMEDPGIAPEPAMDDLPFPCYDDFFAIWPKDSGTSPRVPLEGSRGCWWGQKQHCVFCSEPSMRYRSKSPERVYREIAHLVERYPSLPIVATDEIIDMRMIGSVTDRLAELPVRPNIYYSLKSNIRKDQLRALARAGVRAIQPGVESFADEVLLQMRKGVTGLRNIQLLKWTREFGIRTGWAILYGFPFDQPAYYERMTQWLPSLTHLPAPRGLIDVRIQRYSPLYMQAEDLGVKNLRPAAFYSLIYNLDQTAIDRLAYRFDWDGPEDQDAYTEPLKKEVNNWIMAAKTSPPVLVYVDRGNSLVIGDTRPAAARPIHQLDEMERVVCLACEYVVARHQILSALSEAGHGDQAHAIDAILERLIEERLILRHDGLYLFLAYALTDACMPPPEIMRQVAVGAAPTSVSGPFIGAASH